MVNVPCATDLLSKMVALELVNTSNYLYMGVSKNRGTPKSSILIWFYIIFTIHFGVPVFLETPI